MSECARLDLPEHNMYICAGDRIRLGRFSDIEWIVGYGWYTWGGNRPVCGWYLMQLNTPGELKPLNSTDLIDIYVVGR